MPRKTTKKQKHDWKFVALLIGIFMVGLMVYALNRNLSYKGSAHELSRKPPFAGEQITQTMPKIFRRADPEQENPTRQNIFACLRQCIKGRNQEQINEPGGMPFENPNNPFMQNQNNIDVQQLMQNPQFQQMAQCLMPCINSEDMMQCAMPCFENLDGLNNLEE